VSSTVIESPVSYAVGQLIVDEEQVFLRRQPRSTELIALAREHLAGGATSNWQIAEPQAVWMSHGAGSKVYDVDGTEYVDMHGGYGASIAGHAHPAIVAAVSERVRRGTHFAQPTEDAIWIAGSRRSFPIAAYLDYALQHTDKRIGLVTALGSMHQGQMRSVRKGDVMIAISFAPYAEETLEVAQAAVQQGARLIAITDSRMSPLARDAHIALIVQDSSTFGFRSLTSTMGLAQSLFMALAYRLELPYQSTTILNETARR